MIIKKFQAATETEGILMAKHELGDAAVIMNIKTIKHRGIARLFKKDVVEVTAALEERAHTTDKIPVKKINAIVDDSTKPVMELDKQHNTAIEQKLDNLQNMLQNKISTSVAVEKKENEAEDKTKEKSVNFKFMQLVYRQLLDNEVDEKYANQIIGEIESGLKKESNIDSILAGIYQKIILKLGQPKIIEAEEKKTKLVFFMGPTGVGKTTTIAKLASYFKLEKKLKVALITCDTYRIAAVEQLRTYANILDVPLQVVYTIEEFNSAVKGYKDYDLIFVDTAGRSHKNNEQCNEILHFVNDCQIDENVEKETFLVLSAATKYKDLLNINQVFSTLKNYSIIFTKLDETTCLGNILNMKLHTGLQLSYVTSGQAVPDDISIIDAQKIARNLLGSAE
ncbi:MAG: flagellar biosynthesis protein FlhF [Lachnospiraceae bacterium]|nr:flagellar biosynthesis protein FlhF [Lachnospiraceae bacterium]MEE0862183.1 flagellar biosynthesis protein FlhF [Lachnospiraceae bacterium]